MEFPNKGDVIIADAEPHAGHEMGGHNPSKGNIRAVICRNIIGDILDQRGGLSYIIQHFFQHISLLFL